MPQHSNPCSVYRYYDTFGALIYVGVTSRGVNRNLEHSRKARWWKYVANQDVQHLPSLEAALALEAGLIREFHPPFNKQHNGVHANPDAYERLVSQVNLDETFDQQYRRLDKRLPLHILDSEPDKNGIYTFASSPADWQVAMRTTSGLNCRLVADRCQGSVVGVTHVGPILMIEAKLRAPYRITSAYGRLVSPSLKHNRVVTLKSIIATTAPRRLDLVDPFGPMSDRLRSCLEQRAS